MNKKKKVNHNNTEVKKESIRADIDGQIYGLVEKNLGGCFFSVKCFDNKVRRCKNRKRRVKVEPDDIVIVSIREFEDKNGDIIHKYNSEEVKNLHREGLIPKFDSRVGDNKDEIGKDDCIFDFNSI